MANTALKPQERSGPGHLVRVPQPGDGQAPARGLRLNPAAIGQRIVDRLWPMLNAHHCGLYLWDPAARAFTALAIAGGPVLVFDSGPGRPRAAGVLDLVVRDRRPVMAPDLLGDPAVASICANRARDRLGKSAFRAVLAVPLLAHDRVLGALAIADRTGQVFGAADLRLAQIFAERAGICLESARLVQEAESRRAQVHSLLARTNGSRRRMLEALQVQRTHDRNLPSQRPRWLDASAQRAVATDVRRRLAALSRLAALVSSSLDPQHVFTFIAVAASRLLHGAASLLLLPDETGEALGIAASHGLRPPGRATALSFPAREGVTGWVFQQREALVIPDLLADARTVKRDWIEEQGLRAFAGIPLMVKERCLGVLCAMRKDSGDFELQDVELLEGFASHAATAIQNARLYERAQAEKERLRGILEAMPEAVLVAEGSPEARTIRFVMANRRYEEFLGSSKQVPSVQTETFEVLHPDGSLFDEAELPLRRAIWLGEAVRDLDMTVRFRDGTQRSLLASVALVRESAGLRQAVAVFEDITERKLLEQKAHFEAARLAAIMGTIPEPVLILDADSGIVLQANRAALRFREGPIVGVRFSDLGFRLLSADGAGELPPSEWPDQRAFCGETVRGEQVIFEFPSGERMHYLVSAAPVPAPGGRRRQTVLIAADVSPLKRVEAELQHLAADNLALYNRAVREAEVKGLLLEELNHRVRNSLETIVSFMELQQETLGDPQAEAVLEDAAGRVRGLALVHRVLAAEGFQASEYGSLARGLAEQTLLRGPLAGRVAVHVADQSLRLPSAQLSALGLITNELLTNIVKHAFPGRRKGTVWLTVENTGPEVTIRVRDDGVGLPPGFAAQPGHLGLRLVRSLAEVSLQGTFALAAGEGTTATIRFPSPNLFRPEP